MITLNDYLFNITEFTHTALCKDRISYGQWCKTLIDYPAGRFNSGTAQIGLKLHRFMDRRCFRQGNQKYFCKFRITQMW